MSLIPFFLKKYGVTDYQGFIKEAVQMFPDLSMSFEVLSDDLETMESEVNANVEKYYY